MGGMITLSLRSLAAGLAFMLGVLWSGGDALAEGPERDPRNWPTITRLVQDRYEHAGQIFTLRVHAKRSDYYNCSYRGDRSRVTAFTLLGGPLETITGYMPKDLGAVLKRILDKDPWAPITVEVRFDPQRLGELCPNQVDILKWSQGWRYPPKSLSPEKPDPTVHPTAAELKTHDSKQLWKQLRRLDSSYIGQHIQLTAGARVTAAYHCAFRGATRSHYAVRLHNGSGRFIHGYLPRNDKAKKLVDYIALHRDVPLVVQGRVVKLALSNYCKPQLEITGWTLGQATTATTPGR